jgi:threonine aldolase
MAALGASWSDLRTAGVDVLSFGGTKNGLWAGEAVVFLQPELARKTASYRKQQAQLHSKMRFISGQFIPFLQEQLWKENALHANAMAQRLAALVTTLPEVILRHPVEANGVFASIPLSWNAPLMEKFPFYIFEPEGNVARWMCAWDTQEEDIQAFFEAMKSLSSSER